MLLHKLLLLSFIITNLSFGFAIPKEEIRRNEKTLSDKQHYKDDEHNTNYDHDAFLGEEASSFDQLSPEESVLRLSKIVDKIDKNNDGSVTLEELKEWIHNSQKNYILEDSEKQWLQHNPKGNEYIYWDDYKKTNYGFLDDTQNTIAEEERKTYNEMLTKDERRWKIADKNKDSKLNKEEFFDFIHPEEAEHMRDIIIDETFEDIDKDKDGKISLSEYISDMYAPETDDENMQPDWITQEKEQFTNYRDKNKDGFMDREEVGDWISPVDYDRVEGEARHLINEADQNKDGELSKEEILNNYDIFVGSQATDFGEALMKHDEF